MTLSEALDKFQVAYSSTRLCRHDDCIVYGKIPFGHIGRTHDEMNWLIKSMDLPLKTTKTGSILFFDSIIVEGNPNA
jgi:hypothetical protein